MDQVIASPINGSHVLPYEATFSLIDDIPDTWLERYSDYLMTIDEIGKFYYFDWNQNEMWDRYPASRPLSWTVPNDHVARFVDL